MQRAAPERADALRKLFDDHSILVRYTPSDKFEQGEAVEASPNTFMGVIQFPPVMHTLSWLLVHGGWEAMRNYGTVIKSFKLLGAGFNGTNIEAVLNQNPEIAKCTEIIDCAVKNSRGMRTPLPSWLPNIIDTSPDPDINRQYDAVRELWLIAQCWFLLHELQHILFRVEERDFLDFRLEELACDTEATAWVLEGVECYSAQTKEPCNKVRGKRAMGILVGLFCIGWLSEPGGTVSHPPLKERLRILLEQVGAHDAGRFWDFAVGLLFVLSKDQKTVQFPANTTMRGIALQLAETV